VLKEIARNMAEVTIRCARGTAGIANRDDYPAWAGVRWVLGRAGPWPVMSHGSDIRVAAQNAPMDVGGSKLRISYCLYVSCGIWSTRAISSCVKPAFSLACFVRCRKSVL